MVAAENIYRAGKYLADGPVFEAGKHHHATDLELDWWKPLQIPTKVSRIIE